MSVMNQTVHQNSSRIHSVPLGLVLGGISLITVVMNILVLYAVKIEKKLHTVGNLYIVSLSCADLIVGAAVMPLNIVYLLKRDLIDRNICLFWLSVDYVASTASIFSLFVLCIDRYRSIQQPLKYLRYRTKTRASIMISTSWLLSFLWVIPILGWRSFTNNSSTTIDKGTNDTNLCETDFSSIIWFKILTAMVNFYVPSLMMLWFYAKIYKAVRRHYQHRKLINGSCISASEKSIVNNGKPHEMQKISSRGTNKTTEYPYNENDNLMEVKHQRSSCVKMPAVSHREDGSDTLKPTCFPSTNGQNDRKVDNMDKKCAHVKKDIQNTEMPCTQNYDLSRVSDEHIFTKRLSSRNDDDLALDQSSYTEGCFLQYHNNKDHTSLSYLKKTWRRMRAYSTNYSQGLHINRDRKAAKQLGCIMAAFMLCWSPYFVLFMVMAFCKGYQNIQLHMFTIWLGYVNSTLNPFIYPLCNENFKKTFKKILHIKT
ncbi:histamine H1 receptor [Tiliqua scincoides]|uniref:histamine H1 receptor n=1 Tax=Tiliqua scincoides TaxID=71010 RepID=UPI00346328AA